MDVEKLKEYLSPEKILLNEPMSRHTSFKIGGPADVFIKADTLQDIKFVLEHTKQNKVPLFMLGNGTNLLVRDNGIRGIVLKINMQDVAVGVAAHSCPFSCGQVLPQENETLICVQSGCTLAKLAQIALKHELTGLEPLAGIPGTIGGAIKMNAGAYGGEMKDIVVSTVYMDDIGNINTIGIEEHDFSYRHSMFSDKNYIILETVIRLNKSNKEDIKARMDEYSFSRKKSQPIEYPSAGSVFRRLDGIFIAKLIDEAGLKGYNIGDAEISTKHTGFIINKGNATAKDVLNLIEHIKRVLKEKFDVEVELEIIVVGEELK